MPCNAREIRAALISVLPENTAMSAQELGKQFVFLPLAHTKALRLSCNLVVGARGVGKSFWTRALSDEVIRSELAKTLPDLLNLVVHNGYASQSDRLSYPDKDTFSALLEKDYTPYHVWRAVVYRWLLKLLDIDLQHSRWDESVAWVKNNPEDFVALAEQANKQLIENNLAGLILFDSLDVTNDDWQVMDDITRDLLKVLLWLRSFSRLNAKVFLRSDQFQRKVLDFPDASKLQATKVDLNWSSTDLYGLLWQYLCNAENVHGECLRALYQQKTQLLEREGFFIPSNEFKRDAQTQRSLFELLAGKWMGRDRRRGVPYVWTVSHLADGQGITSPRSFLIALRKAAEFTELQHADFEFALHYDGIKKGVQEASSVRVQELKEDYWWLGEVAEPLRGITLPCEFSVIEDRWQENFQGGVASITRQDTKSGLPVQNTGMGWLGLKNDLEQIGVFKTKKDGRIDMPDLYRVGFGLGRRGGVKPAFEA